MVRSRSRLLLALCIGAIPQSGFAQPSHLSVATDTNQVEYGRAFSVYLRSDDAAMLERLDLTPVDADFVVHRRGDITRGRDSSHFSMRLRLYPRKPGPLVLPALAVNGTATKPLKINVTTAIDPKDQSVVNVSYELNRQSVWLKQAITVVARVETRADIVDVSAPAFDDSGFRSFVLPLVRKTITTNGKSRTVHRLGWTLYPLVTGSRELQLPAIQYRRDGIVTHRFFPPRYKISVNALPSYVPVTMPVGKVEIEPGEFEKRFYIKNNLESLSFRVTADGLPGQYVSYLLEQLKSTESISLYPAEMQTAQHLSPARLTNRLDYRVPFVPTRMGWMEFPTLRLQFFDPESGKIVTKQGDLGTAFAIPRWLAWLTAILLAFPTVVLLRYSLARLAQYWLRLRNYQTALLILKNAKTPADLRSALSAIARAESWPDNITVSRWLNLWRDRFPAKAGPDQSLLKLQECLYGGRKGKPDEFRADLLEICYHRMPLLMLVNR
jgi:hypothetical protein